MAGPVSIRTSSEFNPAAIVQAQPASEVASWASLMSRPSDVDDIAPPPSAPLVISSPMPTAIEIPLPASIWLGITGVSCAYFLVARVFNPWRSQPEKK
jgi:hypothetical protein